VTDGERKLNPCLPCQEDGGMEPCPAPRCACEGCTGALVFDGFNIDETGCFLICTRCKHCHYAELKEQTK